MPCLSVLAGSTVTLNVLGNDQDVDGDTLHLAGLTRAPTSGSVVLPGDETVRYTLDRNARGPQTMSYEVEDRNGGEAQGQVSVNLPELHSDYRVKMVGIETG